jgi:hypothetical protein
LKKRKYVICDDCVAQIIAQLKKICRNSSRTTDPVQVKLLDGPL